MNPARILLVDDEPDMLENCSRILSRQGHTCLTAANGRAALVVLEQEHPDLLVTDLKMPEMDGMLPLRHAHDLDPALPVIMLTGFATIESAVAAVREGAFDYLPKSFRWTSSGSRSTGPCGIAGCRSRTATFASSCSKRWGSRTSWAGARP